MKSMSAIDFEKHDFVDYDLGKHGVFIGCNYTTYLSTRDYLGLVPNHVYFTDDDEYSLRHSKGTHI